MSESDPEEIEEIREQKREELAQSAGGTDEPVQSAGGADEPVHVEDESHFARLQEEHDVLLVDFYADWCGPCDMLEPIVEDVAAESDAAVAKVDIDQHQGIARTFGVRSVPTLVLFSDGEQVEQLVGVQEKGTLLDVVERER